MKANFVYENLNFKRGQDPKDALEIGDVEGRKIARIRENIKKSLEYFVQK